MNYICIKDCGFYFGDICNIVSQNDKYIVLENQEKQKNVFNTDEFNKWFKKLIVKDVKHRDKFEKLRDELNDIDESKYFEIAEKEYHKQNYYLSIKYLNKNLESKYSNIKSLYNIGSCYYNLNNINEALKYFYKAIKINPNDEDCNKAIKLLEKNKKES